MCWSKCQINYDSSINLNLISQFKSRKIVRKNMSTKRAQSTRWYSDYLFYPTNRSKQWTKISDFQILKGEYLQIPFVFFDTELIMGSI